MEVMFEQKKTTMPRTLVDKILLEYTGAGEIVDPADVREGESP